MDNGAGLSEKIWVSQRYIETVTILKSEGKQIQKRQRINLSFDSRFIYLIICYAPNGFLNSRHTVFWPHAWRYMFGFGLG